jgi:hypothetical protein
VPRSSMDIYIWKDGEERGPYSEQDIREAVANGLIQPQQTARSSEGGDWVPLETLLHLRFGLHHFTPVGSRSITETESPAPAPSPETESPYGLKSPMAAHFRVASVFAFIGVPVAAILSMSQVLTIGQTVLQIVSCLLTGMLLQGMAEALDGLRVIAERLRRIEKK